MWKTHWTLSCSKLAEVCISFIKRFTNSLKWKDSVGDSTIAKLNERVSRVHQQDPVCGVWNCSSDKECEGWCDASSLTMELS